MTNNIYERFIEVSKYTVNKELLYLSIMFNAAPVLTKQKPSSIISFSKNDKGLYYIWDKYKNELDNCCDLKYFELKRTNDYILVMFYNEKNLNETIKNENNMEFLNKFGYTRKMSIKKSLVLLKERFEIVCPHEIGIFLGYPINDVVSFINCSGKNCLLCGYWKVYHNPNKAKQTFNKYNKSKEYILDLIINGVEPSLLWSRTFFANETSCLSLSS